MGAVGLPFAYKLVVKNETGATVSLASASFLRSFLNASGVLSYEGAMIQTSAISAIGNGSVVALGSAAAASDIFSNATGAFLGMDGIFTATGSTSTSGNVGLYLILSPNGTRFADDSDKTLSFALPLATMFFSNTGTTAKSIAFEL